MSSLQNNNDSTGPNRASRRSMSGTGYIGGPISNGDNPGERLSDRPAVLTGWTDAETGEDQGKAAEKQSVIVFFGAIIGWMVALTVLSVITATCLLIISEMAKIIAGVFS